MFIHDMSVFFTEFAEEKKRFKSEYHYFRDKEHKLLLRNIMPYFIAQLCYYFNARIFLLLFFTSLADYFQN